MAWVFVDDELLQEKLVSEGLAEVKYVYNDYKYSAHLKDIELDAKNNGIGMWADVYVSNNVDNSYDNNIFYFIIVCIGIIGIKCLSWMYNFMKKK